MKFTLHEQVLDNLPDAITIQDKDFTIIYQNDASKRGTGAHVGEKCYAVYERRDQICEQCGVQQAFQTGVPTTVLRTGFAPDGTTCYWENSCFALFDGEGNIIAGVEACRNITDRISLVEDVKDRNVELGQLNTQLNQRTTLLQSALREREVAERQLRKEIEERKEAEAQLRKAQKKLVEAAHRAGMADVATDVLHNVGNVLNSINVSTARMIDIVVHSKVASLARVSALVSDHRDELGTFLTEDDRGQQVPVFLEEVSRRLSDEQSQFAEMLDGLAKNVQHIKDTITMQQSYAKISGMEEHVSMVEIIEDAIQINEAGLDRHGVRLVRHYEDLPQVQVNKQKTLQILVNLLSNGKYALSHSAQEDKVITIQLRAQGADTICVEVIDNGVGIAEENLNRIFRHGFTTKKEGHGFGLHSAALAAKEMAGTLSVHSDGLGQGATFALTLPLKRAEATANQAVPPTAPRP